MKTELTEKQKQILYYSDSYARKMGNLPNAREIMKACDFTTPIDVLRALFMIQEK